MRLERSEEERNEFFFLKKEKKNWNARWKEKGISLSYRLDILSIDNFRFENCCCRSWMNLITYKFYCR